jgi:hypothetical protein
MYLAAGLIVGGAAGFIIAKLDDFSLKEKKAMQDKVDQANRELAQYKHDVTEHFIQTAGLVNNMTQSYQAVHEHLAKGAQTLSDHKIAVDRLAVMKAGVIEAGTAPVVEALNEPQVTAQTTAQAVEPEQTEPEQDIVTSVAAAGTGVNAAQAQSATAPSENLSDQDPRKTAAQSGDNNTAEAVSKTNETSLADNVAETDESEAEIEANALIAGPQTVADESGDDARPGTVGSVAAADSEATQPDISAEDISITVADKKDEKSALTDENAVTIASRMVH